MRSDAAPHASECAGRRGGIADSESPPASARPAFAAARESRATAAASVITAATPVTAG